VLTRLRVQGFKNLLDIDVRFGPFTCVAGPNGAGKSNLFDAIHFLHLLTQHPIMDAVRRLRETKGRAPDPRSLFTTFEGFRAQEMRFTVEMLVDRKVQDEFGVEAEASISSLKYELAFRLNAEEGPERLEIIEERLEPVTLEEMRKTLGFAARPRFKQTAITGKRTRNFISTGGHGEITVHQEGHGGRKIPAPRSSRTVLGGMASGDFPTILAAHKEMASWNLFMLEPSAMRASSAYSDPQIIDARGANLPRTINRLEKLEKRTTSTRAAIANILAELIEDVRDLVIQDDPVTETLTLKLCGRDGVLHPARSLSDGTLRFLVLATLSLDPQVKGVICLEEPENGIHPGRISSMVRLLKDIAVDPSLPIGPDNPLRQVVINTHSPAVFRQLSPGDLVYIDSVYTRLDGLYGRVAKVLLPKGSWRWKEGVDFGAMELTSGSIRPYVDHLVQENLTFPFAAPGNGPA
jgi:predicted ATPase